MNDELRAALDKLSRPTWRLSWRDFRVFECAVFWYLDSAESSESLPDAIARELIERGYVVEVDTEDPREWRKTYQITVGGALALADADAAV